MPRYIDADKLLEQVNSLEQLARKRVADTPTNSPAYERYSAQYAERVKMLSIIKAHPAADVAPKSEVDRLEYTLLGVMHSVDKWLDGEELEQDEVNRAATMREKTLRIIENAKSEVVREICREIREEIVAALESNYKAKAERLAGSDIYFADEFISICEGKIAALRGIEDFVEELKKKYTEGGAKDE